MSVALGIVAVACSCCQVSVSVCCRHAALGAPVSAQRQRLTDWPVSGTPGASRAQIEKVADWSVVMLTGTSW